MAGFNRGAVKKLATKRTAGTYRQIFLHTLVTLGAGILITILDSVLLEQIGTTGGLSGLGTRSVLETLRTVLQYANMLLLPFWEMSIFYWAIRRARGLDTQPGDFLEGFRRFAPVLRLKLLQGIVVWMILMGCTFISSLIYSFSPLALPVINLLLPYAQDIASLQAAMADEALMTQMISYMYPVYIIMAVLTLLALLPLFYRFRMAEYELMDEKGTGAIKALIRSFQMTRKQSWNLIKLDLSYWWYFVLQILCVIPMYASTFAPLLGIAASETVLTVGGYAVTCLAQLILFSAFRGRIETTYALTYNALRASIPEKKSIVPWNPQ